MIKRVLPTLLAGLTVCSLGGLASASTDSTVPDEPAPTTSTTETTTSDDGNDGSTADERRAINPRQYFDNYQSAEFEASATATPAGAPGTQVNAAPPPMAEPSEAEVDAPMPPPPPPMNEPGIDEDNTFVDAGDSVFVAVDDDRESTFGLDVDTGSYRTAQPFLDQGMLPPADSIRPEEWINAFDYGDSYEREGEQTALDLDVETAVAPFTDDGTQMVRIAMHAAGITDDERPAAHLTFVVDTSGSMDIRERLGLVQSSLALLVQNLRDDDTIAIVTYGDMATALLEPTEVRDYPTILEAIDELVPSGSTNMEAGLMLGYEAATESFVDGDINAVILASDGVANVGTTDSTVLVDQIAEAGGEGIGLVTVGYGMGNYNDHLMEQLSNLGDGFYSYVDTYEEAVRLFVEDLNSTLTPVAMDAKSQVVFDDEVVTEYRLIGYENRRLDDSEFRDDAVDAGEVGAGHSVTALYEVRLVEGASAGTELGEARLRWTPVGGGEAVEIDEPIVVADEGAEGSEALRLGAVVAATAEVAKGNTVVTERGVTYDDLAAAADELDQAGVDGADEIATRIKLLDNAQG